MKELDIMMSGMSEEQKQRIRDKADRLEVFFKDEVVCMKDKEENYVGKVFKTNSGASCIVVSYSGCNNVKIRFLDETNYEMVVHSSNLKSGRIKSPYTPIVYGVGFLGVGKFKPSSNGIKNKYYELWCSIIARCYSEKRLKQVSFYRGCSVCKEWHNFQNFAKWYTEQEFCFEGYHLDKDILVEGNKVYSPETCSLVPMEINILFTDSKASRGDYPIGVHLDKSSGKFTAQISCFGKRLFLGRFDTVEEAYNAYKVKKEEYVKEVANKYKGEVSNEVYSRMMEWKPPEYSF